MQSYETLSVPEEQRRQSLISQSGRRGSYTTDDVSSPRSPRPPPRNKPPLDEATLAARQQYAAHGIMVIMRRKVARRRRILREQTSVMTEVGDGVDEHSVAVDMTTADEDDVGKAPRTMNNSYIISAIPYLAKPVAAVCLVLNIILPGSGLQFHHMPDFDQLLEADDQLLGNIEQPTSHTPPATSTAICSIAEL